MSFVAEAKGALVWATLWALVACQGTALRTAKLFPEGEDVGGAPVASEVYARSHAVVIGINSYERLAPLSGAVKDAEAVAEDFRARGMSVTLLTDEAATREAIAGLLGDTLRDRVGPEDRVVVYFAGHGTTVGSGSTTMGYLMPVGGDFARPSATGISMGELQNWLRTYPSKHVLFVADACYSGLAIPHAEMRGGVPKHLARLARLPVEMTLVAGGRHEQVIDDYKGHGLFTYHFLRALRGGADYNQDGVVTGYELGTFVQERVSRVAASEFRRDQNPHMGHRGEGQLIFRVDRGRSVASAPGLDEGGARRAEPPMAVQGHRVALVIGNSGYKDPLGTAINDARAMADKLRAEGYVVMDHYDVGQKAMRKAIVDFGTSLSKGGAAWFYYSGYALQVRGDNYLLPVDVELVEEGDIKVEGVPMKVVMKEIEAARTTMNVIMVEASYEVPFAPGPLPMAKTNGLAPVKAPPGSIVALSNTPGLSVRAPAAGKSVFTEAVLEHLSKPGWSVEQAFAAAGDAVRRQSSGAQAPWADSALAGEAFFAESSLGVPRCPEGTALSSARGCVPMLAVACPEGTVMRPGRGCWPGADMVGQSGTDQGEHKTHADKRPALVREALVIGNGAYRAPGAVLQTSVSDAKAVAEVLKRHGFHVSLHIDLDRASMLRAVRDFKTRIKDSSAIFYYAGHSLQHRGQNLLLPIDADMAALATGGRREGVPLARVLEVIGQGDAKASAVVLDSPRGNPDKGRFASAVLGPIARPEAVHVVTAVAPREEAVVGQEDRGRFTEALMWHLKTPGLTFEGVLERVGEDVSAATAGQQRPWWSLAPATTEAHPRLPISGAPKASSGSDEASLVCPKGTLPLEDKCLVVVEEIECPVGLSFVVGRGCRRPDIAY